VSALPSRERRPLGRSPFFWAAVAGLVAIPALRPFLRHVPDPPPVLGQLPPFALVDQRGQPKGLADLRGEVWVASFFFTSCPTVCPKLMRAAKELRARFDRDDVPVRLVSVTVDPQNDTPPRLLDYAREYGLDTRRWDLLTGSPAAVRGLVVDGFATHMGERGDAGVGDRPVAGELMDIAHSTHFVLVDGRGRIRGYYGSDEPGRDEVFHRAQHVLREEVDAPAAEARPLATERTRRTPHGPEEDG
jgi:protein SCO1/2